MEGETDMYFDQFAFGERLKKIRESMGLSQEKMAEMLSISKVHYGNMERGKASSSVDLLVEMACCFHVSTDYLLLGKSIDRERDAERLQGIIEELMEIRGRM